MSGTQHCQPEPAAIEHFNRVAQLVIRVAKIFFRIRLDLSRLVHEIDDEALLIFMLLFGRFLLLLLVYHFLRNAERYPFASRIIRRAREDWWPAILLDHVGQFMRQQLLSAVTEGSMLSRAKHYVVSDCVRESLHRSRGFRGSLVRVHANVGEVITKARLQVGPRLSVESRTGRPQYFIDDSRD
jgi:hypothetical protein